MNRTARPCAWAAALLALGLGILAQGGLPGRAAVASDAPPGVQVQVRGADGAPLAHAAIYLESAAARQVVRERAPQRIVQKDKRFVPPVTAVPVGTAIQFPNEDTVRHHVYSFSPAKTFELKLYIGTPAEPVVFDQVGTAVLGCNIHDQMIAWVHVVDTPHVGVTDAQGQVVLVDVPPGQYQLRTWHPAWPEGQDVPSQALTLSGPRATAQVTLAVTGLPAP